jgi:hypothetical protein
MRQIDETRVRKMLDIALQVEGSQKVLAKKMGVSAQYLCDVMKNRRALSGATSILNWLGLEAVVSYRRKDGGQL